MEILAAFEFLKSSNARKYNWINQFCQHHNFQERQAFGKSLIILQEKQKEEEKEEEI